MIPNLKLWGSSSPPKESNDAPMAIKIVGLIVLLVSAFVFLATLIPIVLIPFGPILIFSLRTSEPYVLAISAGFFVSAIGIRKMRRWAFFLGAISILATVWAAHIASESAHANLVRQNVDQRDGKRFTDIDTIDTDLSTYYKKYHAYPPANAASTCEPVSAHLNGALGGTFTDPTPGQSYMYAVDSITNPQHYVVMAKLEGSNEATLPPPFTARGMVLGCDCTGTATHCLQR